MTQRILIMGLPGAGKTTLAAALKRYLEENGTISDSRAELLPLTMADTRCQVNWFNADDVRRKYNDWDFSQAGRIRQSLRMFQFSLAAGGDYVICDFVAPLVEQRNNFKADWTIWVDTIREGRYADTNAAFVEPEVYDFRVTEQDCEKWAEFIGTHIVENRRRPVFDWKKESTLLLGRYQPWHNGHRALFERALAKTGQVVTKLNKKHLMIQHMLSVLQRFVKSWALNSTESAVRSLVKAYSYRCCGTVTTVVISYAITGQLIVSLGIGAVEMIVKPAVYWMHERVWSRIKWGRQL